MMIITCFGCSSLLSCVLGIAKQTRYMIGKKFSLRQHVVTQFFRANVFFATAASKEAS
jgi:hypothetical protein